MATFRSLPASGIFNTPTATRRVLWSFAVVGGFGNALLGPVLPPFLLIQDSQRTVEMNFEELTATLSKGSATAVTTLESNVAALNAPKEYLYVQTPVEQAVPANAGNAKRNWLKDFHHHALTTQVTWRKIFLPSCTKGLP